MRDGEDLYFLRFEHRPPTPEQLRDLQRRAERAAKDYRAQVLRGLCVGAVASLRRAAGGGRDVVRTLRDRAAAAASKRWRAYALGRERRAAVRELAALDDRMLKDFGLHRSEIENVVYGAEAARSRAAQSEGARRSRIGTRLGACADRRPAPLIDRSAA